jgi:hypothetical protein
MSRIRDAVAVHRGTVAPVVILALALCGVVAVWVFGAAWSFAEQARAATGHGFDLPALLFWTTDVLAVSGALLALAAAVDNRSAPVPRLVVAGALSASAWWQVAGVAERTGGYGATPLDALAMAAGVPLASFVALEMLLGQVRRIVRRWRGQAAPVAVPGLPLVRLMLAPRTALSEWRSAVLAATAPGVVPVATADRLRAELAASESRVLALVPHPVDPAALAAGITADVLREVGGREVAEPMSAEEIGQIISDRMDRLGAALRRDLDRVTSTARESAVSASREAVGRYIAELPDRAPRREPGGTRPGRRTGGTRPSGTGTKRDRAEREYRRLVDAGTAPEEITGAALARAVEGPAAGDASGYYRSLIKSWREAGTPGAEVVVLNGHRPGGA